MALKFYTSVTKGLKLNVRKCWGLILTFVEVAGKKTSRRGLLPHIPILNRVKFQSKIRFVTLKKLKIVFLNISPHMLFLGSYVHFFLIGIHSTQDWKITTTYGVKAIQIISQMKAFYRQRISGSSCTRKETVDTDISVITKNGDRKMQSIRIMNRPSSRIRKWNQLSQFK